MTKAQKIILSVTLALWLPIYLYLIKGFCTSTTALVRSCAVNNLIILPTLVTLILAVPTIPMLWLWKKDSLSLFKQWSYRDYLLSSGFFLLGVIFIIIFASLCNNQQTKDNQVSKPALQLLVNTTKFKVEGYSNEHKKLGKYASFTETWDFLSNSPHWKSFYQQYYGDQGLTFDMVKSYYDKYPRLAGYFPPPQNIDVLEFDMDGDGQNEEAVMVSNDGGNHSPQDALIIKNDEIIFRAGSNSLQPHIMKAENNNGFNLEWTSWDQVKAGQCCPTGYMLTRFTYNNGIFSPVSEQEIKTKPEKLALPTKLSENDAIQLVKNLPEVKKYLKNHQNEATESGVYYSAGTVDIDSNRTNENFITIHVYLYTQPNNQNFGMDQSFNYYTFDRVTGKLKCEFAIFDQKGNLIRITNEYPCS